MSLGRILAAVVVAALAIVLLVSVPRDAASTAASTTQVAAGEPAGPAAAPGELPQVAPAPPALPDGPPFREQDFAVATDMPEGAIVALRSSARTGRSLSVELGTTVPVPEGKQVFANVSVSDALGNTILDCTWRDIELTDDARTLECELPADAALPLAIAGYQLPGPSFVEAPVVVAIDKGIHR